MKAQDIEFVMKKHLSIMIYDGSCHEPTDDQLAALPGLFLGGIDEAAAAIAKRLSEGVVYSGEHPAYVKQDGTVSIALAPIQIGHRPDIAQGEILEVTVKIVEGMKDESRRD